MLNILILNYSFRDHTCPFREIALRSVPFRAVPFREIDTADLKGLSTTLGLLTSDVTGGDGVFLGNIEHSFRAGRGRLTCMVL